MRNIKNVIKNLERQLEEIEVIIDQCTVSSNQAKRAGYKDAEVDPYWRGVKVGLQTALYVILDQQNYNKNNKKRNLLVYK